MVEKGELGIYFQVATLENLFQRNDRLNFRRMIPTIAQVCPCHSLLNSRDVLILTLSILLALRGVFPDTSLGMD